MDLEIAHHYLLAHPFVHRLVAVLLLSIGAVLCHYLMRYLVSVLASIVAPRIGGIVADLIQDRVLFSRLSLFVPILVLFYGFEYIPDVNAGLVSFFHKLMTVAAIISGIRIVTRLMFKGNEIYMRYPISRVRPIKGYLQVAAIVLYILGLIFVVATLMNQSPLVFVSGLGAMTAIILLVFRDTILSLVAGVQLTTNDLIRVGDWIEMPQFGADGDVVDIALHVVKVQNWDKTITMIPTHKFLENSFKNWRGMSESGGRRIKRSIFIDMNTVRFLSREELAKFGQYNLLAAYIKEKIIELEEYNRHRHHDDALVSNARRLTNLGTFRAYITQYLRQHPHIHQNMTFLVRQLHPTAEGLPLEIYVFANDTRWAFYEGIQADIFDHMLAVIPQFGLRIYQKPSGYDLRELENLPAGGGAVVS